MEEKDPTVEQPDNGKKKGSRRKFGLNKLFKALERLVEEKREKHESVKSVKSLLPSSRTKIATFFKKSSESPERAFEKSDGKALYDPFAWVRWVLLWTNGQICFLLIACICVWGLVYKVSQRDYMVIDLPQTLSENIAESYKLTDKDLIPTISQFIGHTLGTLNSFNFETPPRTDWLVGRVNPDILNHARSRNQEYQRQIESSGMIQSLTITRIEDVFRSANGKRVTANARGYLTRIVMGERGTREQSVTIPYRARVVILISPENRLNAGEYYLMQVAEAAGQEGVRRFDRLLEQNRGGRQ